MCFIQGSVEQATSICPMCKLFKPTGGASRCPHIIDVCRNRQSHPAHDVVYLKNAEVQTFNGCGFCKWAQSNPAAASKGHNTGWPGCCRPPTATEAKLISPADWKAVAVVHKVQLPTDIRALLDALDSMGGIPPRTQTTPPKTTVALGKVPPGAQLTSPKVSRGGGASPKPAAATLTRDPRVAPTSPTLSPPELRRTSSDRRDVSPVPKPGSLRRSHEGEREAALTSPRRNSAARRPPPSASQLAAQMAQANLADESRPVTRRRGSGAGDTASTHSNSPPSSRFVDVKNTPSAFAKRPPRRLSGADSPKSADATARAARPIRAPPSAPPPAPIASGASDGSSSSSALSESTVTSEAFTDYLSDESDAELQRQAEVKAAKTVVRDAEDVEFAAARRELVAVDLRPPTTWRPAATVAGRGLEKRAAAPPPARLNVVEFGRAK